MFCVTKKQICIRKTESEFVDIIIMINQSKKCCQLTCSIKWNLYLKILFFSAHLRQTMSAPMQTTKPTRKNHILLATVDVALRG